MKAIRPQLYRALMKEHDLAFEALRHDTGSSADREARSRLLRAWNAVEKAKRAGRPRLRGD